MATIAAAAAIASVEVRVAGEVVGPEVVASVAAVRVAERLSCPAQCELRLVGVHHGDRFPIGDALEVRIATDDSPVFSGEITALTHTFGADHLPEVRVRAYDVLHRLRKRQSVRAFLDTDAATLARELVAGLDVDVELDGTAPTWPQLVQHRQNDLELLDLVARRAGLWFALHDHRLQLARLGGTGDPVLLTYGTELVEVAIEQNSDPACRAVTAFGWDAGAGGALRGEEATAAPSFALDAATAPDRWDVDGTRVLAEAPGADADALAALARADLDLRVGRELVVTGTAAGDARLRVGARVEVAGLDRAAVDPLGARAGGAASGDQLDGLQGPHALTEIVHTLDALGYLTWFTSRPPDAPPPTIGASLAIAVVTDVDDPDQQGRAKVRFPGLDDLGSLWVPVVAPAAGAGKGLVALPDVDDVVAVLLPHDDPGRGVVLGGLFGSEGPFDPGVAGGEVRRFSFATPGGQSVVLDDEHARLRLRDRTGNLVELGSDSMRLHAAVDLVIEAPGRNLTVRAKRVDFEEASGGEDPPAGSGATEEATG